MYKLLATSLLFMANLVFAAAPSGMKIDYVDAHGSGCPEGSAFIDVSPDQEVFTAIFSEFQAEVGPGVPRRDANKYCAMVVSVDVPAGWQYSIFKAKYEGWYELDRGVSLRQTSKYWFQGNRPVRYSSRFRGPASGVLDYTDHMGVSSWSPCGGQRNMIIDARLGLRSRNKKATGVAGIDAIEGSFDLKHHYHIRYRKCRP